MPIIARDNGATLNQMRQIGPHDDAVAITPSNTDEVVDICESFIVGANGTVALVTARGSAVTLTCVAGFEYRLRVRQFKATGTTATGIVALY